MEEAVVDCTNLHITFPAVVYGYLFVARANREEEKKVSNLRVSNDTAILKSGEVVEGMIRLHSALIELSGRRGIRDEVSRYEAASMALVEADKVDSELIFRDFPPTDSPLRIERFFETLYAR